MTSGRFGRCSHNRTVHFSYHVENFRPGIDGQVRPGLCRGVARNTPYTCHATCNMRVRCRRPGAPCGTQHETGHVLCMALELRRPQWRAASPAVASGFVRRVVTIRAASLCIAWRLLHGARTSHSTAGLVQICMNIVPKGVMLTPVQCGESLDFDVYTQSGPTHARVLGRDSLAIGHWPRRTGSALHAMCGLA